MMEVHMMDSLKMDNFMEKVCFNGMMVVFLKVHIIMVLGMDMDNFIIHFLMHCI